MLRRDWRLAVLLVAWGAVVAGAEERSGGGPHFVRVSVGYGNAARADRWAPIRLLIENPGPATDVEVVVGGEETDGTRTALLSRASVHLPAQSLRRHTVYGDIKLGDHVVVELYEREDCVAREVVDYFGTPPHDVMILGCSTVGLGFNCDQPPSVQRPGPRLRFASAESAADLPSRLAGYDPVEALILGVLPPGRMTAMQERAIADWVRSGGLLILCPGGDAPNYGATLEALSPVQMLGTRLVPDLPPLALWYGAVPPGANRIGLTEAVLRDGRTLMEMDGVPLIVSRPEGAGEVVFVAFDLSHERVVRWPRLVELYRDLIERRETLPRLPDTRVPEEAATQLSSMVGVPVPSRWLLGGCLAANLAVVAALLFLLRRRGEVAFLILVVVAPVVALIVNAVGSAAPVVVEATLASVHVVTGGTGEAACSVSGYYALLCPEEGRCDVQFPERPSAFCKGLAVPIPGPSAGRRSAIKSMGPTMEFVDADAKWLRGLLVRPRVLTMFQSSEAADLAAPLEATATLGPDGVRFDLVNRSDRELTDVVVAYNRNAVAIGHLAPGETKAAILDSRSAQEMMAGFSSRVFVSGEDAFHDRILRALYQAQRTGDLSDTGALAMGWTRGAPVAADVVGLQAELKSDARTLWIVRAETRAGDGRLLLPKGSAAMQVGEPKKPLLVDGLWMPFSTKWTLNVAFGVPAAVRGMKPSRVDVFIRTARVPTAKTISAFDFEAGEYMPLVGKVPGEAALADDVRVSLPDPARYLSPTTGNVLLRLEFHPNVSPTAAAMSRASVLKNLDIEIEGMRR